MECKWNVGVGLQREGLVDRLCVLVSRSVGAEMSTGGNQSHVMPKKSCALEPKLGDVRDMSERRADSGAAEQRRQLESSRMHSSRKGAHAPQHPVRNVDLVTARRSRRHATVRCVQVKAVSRAQTRDPDA